MVQFELQNMIGIILKAIFYIWIVKFELQIWRTAIERHNILLKIIELLKFHLANILLEDEGGWQQMTIQWHEVPQVKMLIFKMYIIVTI